MPHLPPLETVTRIASMANQRGLSVASAESITGGLLASGLAMAPQSSTWFRGGVVECSGKTWRDLLAVRSGSMISERAVMDMADGVAVLLGATTSVAVSGVAGKGSVDGNAPGTVWFGVRNSTETFAEAHLLRGEPEEIRVKTCSTALDLLLRVLSDGA